MKQENMGKKIALVTGATSGLGKAIAEKLAAEGYKVYGAARRDPDPAQERGGIEYLRMDVQDEASVRAGIASIIASVGHVDVLVACAGMGISGAVEDSPMTEIERQMDVNFLGTVRTVKGCLPAMRVQRAGKIIIIGSIAGLIGMPFQAFYSSSKFALEGFVESIRHEVRKFGIDVCVVEPGDFRTGFTGARAKVDLADTAYAETFQRVIGIQEHDERNGCYPSKAANVVAALLRRKRLPARKTVGSGFQRFATFCKRIIPYAWFEAFYRIYYKV